MGEHCGHLVVVCRDCGKIIERAPVEQATAAPGELRDVPARDEA